MLALVGTVALVHLIALMTPGPDFFFVTRTAVSQSRPKALMGVLGITIGCGVWAGVSLGGLQLLFVQLPWLQNGIMAVGGLYLGFMGVSLMRGALRAPAVLPDAGEAAHEDTMRHPFLYGLFTNLSNPKAVIYFGSIFSGLLSPDLPSWFTGGIFALVILETFLWFGFVALVFGMENLRRGYRKAARWIDGFAGILFVGFGLSLIAAAAGLR